MIDLAMQNYYNPAIDYFNDLDSRVKSLLNKKWSFCFEYFPDEQPANIKYKRVPKNKLVLTSINKSGKYEFVLEELEELAMNNIIRNFFQGGEALLLFLGFLCKGLAFSPPLPFPWGPGAKALGSVLWVAFDGTFAYIMTPPPKLGS